jgi:hypothetical protein
VKHAVHVDVLAAVTARPLDELQCHGAEALLSDALGGAEVIDFRVAAHPDGLLLIVFADTGTEEQAAAYVRDLVEDALTHARALADWQVVHCRIASDAPDPRSGFCASDARPGFYALDPRPGFCAPGLRPRFWSSAGVVRPSRAADPAEPTLRHIAARRAALAADAAQVRAFGLDSFAYRPHDPARSVPREDAAVAAGALLGAAVRLLDQLFADVLLLADEAPSPAQDSGLPPAYAVRYTAAYARRFLVAAACVTGRLTQRVWRPPAGIAEAIALDLLVDQAKALVTTERLMDVDRAETVYAAFSQRAYDHREPYRSELDGIHHDTGPVGFGSWFVPFDPEHPTHPYGRDAA